MRPLARIALAAALLACPAHAEQAQYGPPMAPSAANAVLPAARENLLALPHVATNAALAAAANAAFPNGVRRDHYAAGGFADGPLMFFPQTGTCAANGWVNDGGNCVDSTSGDGNSWKALHKDGIFDVREFGAKGDNSTDDTAAIQAAITASVGSEVRIPAAHYCIKTGPVNISVNGLKFIGTSTQNSELDACGADVAILNITGARAKIADMVVLGSVTLATTNDTITLGGGTNIVLDHVWAQFGRHVINVTNSTNNTISNSKLHNAYGSSVVNVGSGGQAYILGNNQIDQLWPQAWPGAAAIVAPSAWAATHAYAQGNVVSNSGFYLQETAASCTSAGSAPINLAYGSTINDGTCTWGLVAPTTYYGVQADTGSVDVFIKDTDITGPYTYSVGMTNSLAGTAPQSVYIGSNVTTGQGFAGGILANAGFDLTVSGSQIENCTQTACVGINTQSSFSGTARIVNNTIRTNPYGVNIGAGTYTLVENNLMGQASSACVNVQANRTNFAILGNSLGTSAWGVCANSVVVGSGSSDYYNISNNIINGASAGISDSGTGTHKTLTGNN